MFHKRLIESARQTASNSEARGMLSRTAILIVARVAGSFLTMVYTLLLARVTSPAQMGTAMSALSVAFLLSVVASMNVESGSIQFLTKYLHDDMRRKAAGFVTFSWWIVGIVSLVLIPVVVLLAVFSPTMSGDASIAVYVVTLMLAPVLGLTRVDARHAGALNAVLQGVLPRMLVRPALFTVVLAVIYLVGISISADFVMLLYLIAAVVVVILQVMLLKPKLGFVSTRPRDMSDWRLWLRTGVMLAPMLVMNEYMNYVLLASASVGMAAPEVARLGIALSLQNFLVYSLTAVDMSFAPQIARAIVKEEGRRYRRVLTAVSGLKCAALLAGAVVVYFLREPLLGLFGDHYLAAGDTFFILLLIPFANALFGPTTLVLNVRGHRKDLLTGSLVGMVGMAVATPVGGWMAGLNGAALAASAAFFVQQAVLYVYCRRRTGVDPSAFAAVARAFQGA